MEYSTIEAWQDISETGIVYTLGSLYDRFQQIQDPRKAKGKQYSLLNSYGADLFGETRRKRYPG